MTTLVHSHILHRKNMCIYPGGAVQCWLSNVICIIKVWLHLILVLSVLWSQLVSCLVKLSTCTCQTDINVHVLSDMFCLASLLWSWICTVKVYISFEGSTWYVTFLSAPQVSTGSPACFSATLCIINFSYDTSRGLLRSLSLCVVSVESRFHQISQKYSSFWENVSRGLLHLQHLVSISVLFPQKTVIIELVKVTTRCLSVVILLRLMWCGADDAFQAVIISRKYDSNICNVALWLSVTSLYTTWDGVKSRVSTSGLEFTVKEAVISLSRPSKITSLPCLSVFCSPASSLFHISITLIYIHYPSQCCFSPEWLKITTAHQFIVPYSRDSLPPSEEELKQCDCVIESVLTKPMI